MEKDDKIRCLEKKMTQQAAEKKQDGPTAEEFFAIQGIAFNNLDIILILYKN